MDGTRIKAVNSMDRSYSGVRLKKTIEDIDGKIERYLHDMDENDAIEEDIVGEKIEERSKSTLSPLLMRFQKNDLCEARSFPMDLITSEIVDGERDASISRLM